jgi:hypothetical protein
MKINKPTKYALAILVIGFVLFALAGVSDAATRVSNSNTISSNTSVTVNTSGTKSTSSGCNQNCVYPPLQARCIVSTSRANIGETVTWTTEGSGGTGIYSFSWTGTDGLSSSHQTISKEYQTSGTKTGTVRITSGNQTITRTCSVVIEEEEENDDLGGYCTGRPSRPEEDEKVTWTAHANGGDGDYEYDWSGDEGLDGDDRTVEKRYDDEGTKTARVRITSDGKSITRTCTVKVEEEDEDNDDLEAYCKASPRDADEGDKIRWTVYPDGGDGDYDYDWSGTDGLDGDDRSIEKRYSKDGKKEAKVTVESDGDKVTVRCYADIDEDDKETYVPPKHDDGIYLSSLPATGISPNAEIGLFVAGLTMWSAFLAYLYLARKNEKMKEAEMLASIGE